jgi:peptidoglycan/xylan/chitin deacetylase (PgdA/CDA1 family)
VSPRPRRAARPLVLGYHAVSSSWRSPLAVPEELLASHLRLLRGNGYTGLTFAEAEHRRSAGTLPERPAVVTFDDGFASILRAQPLLEEAGFPATAFVVTSFVDSGQPLSWAGMETSPDGADADELAPLAWRDLEALVARGWEVGSHTATHPVLPALGDGELHDELESSRKAITARLGACETLAYPYGLVDERVARAAAEAGYLAACTYTRVHWLDKPLRRPRLAVYPTDSGVRLRVKLSPPAARLRRSRLLHALKTARTSGRIQ